MIINIAVIEGSKMYTFEEIKNNWGIINAIKHYVDIQRKFKKFVDDFLKDFEEDIKFLRKPDTLMAINIANIHEHADELIKELIEERECYGYSREDLLQSKNYVLLREIEKDFENYSEQINKYSKASMDLELAKLKVEAESKITGLNYGIISNNLLSLIMYEAQNTAVSCMQVAEANKYYQSFEKQIKDKAENAINLKCQEYYKNIFTVRMRNAVIGVYSDMMRIYSGIIREQYYINLEHLRNFNYNKSINMLKNIIPGKEKEIVSLAIETCPYNLDAFVKADEYGFLDEDDLLFLARIGLISEFNEIICPEEQDEDDIFDEKVSEILECDIDSAFDDGWRNKAISYQNKCRDLIENYPKRYEGYGLLAAFEIAAKYETLDTSFWQKVQSNVDKFFHCSYEQPAKYYEKWIAETILENIEKYVDSINEKIDDFIFDFKYNSDNFVDRIKIAKFKKAIIPALKTYNLILRNMEESNYPDIHISFELRQNTFLWLLYSFGLPIEINHIYYHLSDEERQFAIKLFDELVSNGVDEFDGGSYSFYFKGNYDCFKKFGKDIWRGTGLFVTVSDTEIQKTKGGCYIATAVYGSYDCPEVWTLRRFRDCTLAKSVFGRLFIHTYYIISPTLVKWFGKTEWFKNLWKPTLDKMVAKLNSRGVENTPYKDKKW